MYIRWLNLLFINLNSYYITTTVNGLFQIENLNWKIKSFELLNNINIGPELAILDYDHDNIFIYNICYGLKIETERQDIHLAISFLFKCFNFQYFKLVAGKTINFYNLTINVFFFKSNNLTTFGVNIEKRFNKYENIIVSINANTIRKEFKNEENEKNEIDFKTLKCLVPNHKNEINLNSKLTVIEFSDHMITYIKDDKNKQSFKIMIDYLWQVLLIEDKFPSKELINAITKNYLNEEKKLLPHNYYDDKLKSSNFKKEFIFFLEYFKNNNKYNNTLQINEETLKNILQIKEENILSKINFKNDINLISIIQAILTYFYPIISEKEFENIIKNAIIINYKNFNKNSTNWLPNNKIDWLINNSIKLLGSNPIYNLLNNPNGLIVKFLKFRVLNNSPINIRETLEKQLNDQQNNL